MPMERMNESVVSTSYFNINVHKLGIQKATTLKVLYILEQKQQLLPWMSLTH